MSSIILTGDTSGTLTVSAPLVAGSNTLTLPAATGTISLLTQATSVSASGTSVDFTSIPSWAKRITVMFNSVSTNGASLPLIRLGTGGTPTTTGYVSSTTGTSTASAITTSTTGFIIYSNDAAYAPSGIYVFNLFSGNTWVGSGTIANSASAAFTATSGGVVTLGGVLNMVRITTVNGTDTFDAGSINIIYEG